MLTAEPLGSDLPLGAPEISPPERHAAVQVGGVYAGLIVIGGSDGAGRVLVVPQGEQEG